MPDRVPLLTLVILDGWGCAPAGPGNAVDLAETPVFDRLWREFPHTTIEASGEAAGLPPGQMGNSEVGHLTIGSGRRLYQDLMRVNKSIEDGSFFENPVLRAAFERGKRVHLLGLVSRGGVHSHMEHVQALLRFAPEKTWLHAFTDGRDVSPHAALADLAELPEDRIATVVGRYYAMDRDERWERTQLAYDAITQGTGTNAVDVGAAVQASYDAGITDEFIEPIVLAGTPRLEAGDTAIFFNFRPDRGRQLTRMLLDNGFDVTTMTRYSSDLPTPIAFAEHTVPNTVAEVLLRTASSSSTSPRPRSTPTSPTSSTAGGRTSGRGKYAFSFRARVTCRATTTSPRCPLQGSPTQWWHGSETGSPSASSTSRIPTWSGTPG